MGRALDTIDLQRTGYPTESLLSIMKTNLTWRAWRISVGILLGIAWVAFGQQPIPFVAGITNFDRVNDRLYRGAQPDETGMKNLKQLGVRTIVNLRMADDVWAAEEIQAREAGIMYTNVPMSGTWRPTDEQVTKVLSIIETFPAPVFIHCKRGADRTGTIIACYRLKHDQWSLPEAMREAKQHRMSRWVFSMKSYIKHYARLIAKPAKPRPGRGP
jgi:tyrosine-protein phosphatase SIW14